MIVNEQGNPLGARHRPQVRGDLRDFRRRMFLGAQLNQLDASFDHLPGSACQVVRLHITQIQNSVEPAAAEIGGSQRASYSCNRVEVGFSSKLTEFMTRSTKPVS